MQVKGLVYQEIYTSNNETLVKSYLNITMRVCINWASDFETTTLPNGKRPETYRCDSP